MVVKILRYEFSNFGGVWRCGARSCAALWRMHKHMESLAHLAKKKTRQIKVITRRADAKPLYITALHTKTLCMALYTKALYMEAL